MKYCRGFMGLGASMRCVVTSIAALLLAAGVCRADDDPPIPVAATLPHVLLFSGADLGSYGAFLHGGVLWSPDGLYNSGFTFKMLAGAGSYRYAAGILGSVDVQGRVGLASFMPGWRFKSDGVEITAFAGLDIQDHRQVPFDPFAHLRGTHVGVRAGADLWYEPMRAVMLASNVSVSSIGYGYWTRIAAGMRLIDRFWVGPEALALGDPTYQEYRVGMHLTGLKAGWFEWSAGGGWTMDSDERNGFYGRLGILMRR